MKPQRDPIPKPAAKQPRKPRSRFTRQRPYRRTVEEMMQEPRKVELPWWVE